MEKTIGNASSRRLPKRGSTLSVRFQPPWNKTCGVGGGLCLLVPALCWVHTLYVLVRKQTKLAPCRPDNERSGGRCLERLLLAGCVRNGYFTPEICSCFGPKDLSRADNNESRRPHLACRGGAQVRNQKGRTHAVVAPTPLVGVERRFGRGSRRAVAVAEGSADRDMRFGWRTFAPPRQARWGQGTCRSPLIWL